MDPRKVIRSLFGALTLVAMAAATSSARAEIKLAAPDSFVVAFTQTIAVPPAKAFAAIPNVAQWWESAHTYTGSAANMTIEPRAGGCFCERKGDDSVRHGTVITVWHDELFRIEGAFGPLQSMAVTGILSVELKPDGAGTSVTMTYRVNGASSSALDKLAPAVDGMLGVQFRRLTTLMATGKAAP